MGLDKESNECGKINKNLEKGGKKRINYMSTFVGGMIAGIVGASVITLLIVSVMDKRVGNKSILPASVFVSKYIGSGDADGYLNQGILLSIIYGSLMGGIVAIMLPIVSMTIVNVLVWGVLVGLIVGIIGDKFGMEIVLGMKMDWVWEGKPVIQSRIKFMVVNIIYGIIVTGMLIYEIV
jgi:hypothetical protein|tara:strand:- start:184 stop:720 length:537 start_codon:yes stop_codon:yes gene_type:complete